VRDIERETGRNRAKRQKTEHREAKMTGQKEWINIGEK
jgi:hypothetical protein